LQYANGALIQRMTLQAILVQITSDSIPRYYLKEVLITLIV